jgi:c(7)-type cytochrome triheme protein
VPRAQSNGRDLSSCSTCHSPGGYRRTPETARAFKVGFSHAFHGGNQKLNCNDCHNVRAGLGQGRQVTAPVPKMHHAAGNTQSCISCHNNTRAFGEGNFSDCKKCHKGTTWRM